MKVFILISTLLLSVLFCSSQTAINFSCDDCNGVHHNLFSELDSGKIIVICWVMPCGSCVAPTLSTFDIVQSFEANNPNKVKMYLCDDFGNTSCSTLTNWMNANAIPRITKFSDSSIAMTDYGTEGMPKIVVLGGSNHTVFYNESNSINNITILQNAINTAINASSGILESGIISNIKLYPNPVKNKATLWVQQCKADNIKVELWNVLGKKISDIYTGFTAQGKSKIDLNTSTIQPGIYFIKVDDSENTRLIKLVVEN